MDKRYIITPPCSGKSTFVKAHEGRYRELTIFDHDCACTPFGDLPPLSCVLGVNHVPYSEDYVYTIVLIDKDQLDRYIVKRQEEESKNGWDRNKVYNYPQYGYYAVQQAAKDYGIPVFNTFEKALDFIIDRLYEK